MKKIFTLLLACALYVTFFAFTAFAQETEQNPKLTDNANSWRYENGEIITDPYGTALLADDPYHPNATLTGIDVSKHQGVIDWEKVKAAGIDFAIIRCGYAEDKTEYDDPRWEYNASECERLGIPYGVYLYSYAFNTAEAKSEADHVLRLLKGHSPTMPIYYDMEDNSTLQYDHVAMANAFCKRISDAGYPVGIYASKYWWDTYLADSSLDKWYRWVAQWGSSCTYDGRYEIWQYYNKGHVDGISTEVDMNFLIGYPKDHGVKAGTTLAATAASNGTPKLSWEKLNGVSGYSVYRSTQRNGEYTSFKATGTSYIDSGAKSDVTYYYKVRATYSDGSQGGYSNIVEFTPHIASPSAKLAADTSTGKPILSWGSINSAEKYQVYRKTSSAGSYALQGTVTKNSFTDTSAQAGQTYYYKVRAVYADGLKSPYSTEKNIVCRLSKVTIKSSMISSVDKIRISWQAVPNAAGYSVYRSTEKDGEYTFVKKTVAASYTGLYEQNGKTCWYKVVANHSVQDACSEFSDPTGIDVVTDGITIRLISIKAKGSDTFSWKKVSGATAYKIYCAEKTGGNYRLVGTTTGTSYANQTAQQDKPYYYKIMAVRAKKNTFSMLAGRV